jgi:hypothetical protein
MSTFSYPATLTKQTEQSPPIVLFSAPCIDMKFWAGIPQKKSFGNSTGDETVGFQRVENNTRVDSLERFFRSQQNVIQNTILCAARSLENQFIEFVPIESDVGKRVQSGHLVITPPDISKLTFAEMFLAVKEYLEKRLPELRSQTVPQSLIEKLKKSIGLHVQDTANSDSEDNYESDDTTEVSVTSDDVTSALFEDSHISDFWEEIAARYEIAKTPGLDLNGEEFLGFTRSALAAYVLPTIVVDGQHRLLGAIKSAEESLSLEPWKTEVQELIAKGKSAEEVNNVVTNKAARILPISLLMSDSPAEQVFQFVVVNQKATPIGKPLLGTIVSTTLSQAELGTVQDRLKDAGIPISESRAISFMARDPRSPFYQKINRGMGNDAKDLLDWNVLGQLISIFKNLNGGKLYGEANDYAAVWRRKFLANSPLIEGYDIKGFQTPTAYWSSDTGPWREVFLSFWTEVKNHFAELEDSTATNYWGSPRSSNLFNMVSLTILTADFFSFLCETREPIDDSKKIPELVAKWLTDVKGTYFARNWNLSGVKKDSTGIKKQWAIQWKEYRKDPEKLPMTTKYRIPAL